LDAQGIVDRWQRLKLDRSVHEGVWQEIAEYLRPLRAEFLAQSRTPGARRDQKVFDSTPLIAADNFTGGLYSMMTNPANRWFALKLEDDDLNDDAAVRAWLYAVESRLLQSFGPQLSKFYNVVPALYADLACFGTAVFSSEETFGGDRRILDRTHALADVCISENAAGDVDTVYRRFSAEARNALAMFGEALSRDALRAAERDPYKKLDFIHCVTPAEEGAHHPMASIYVEADARRIVGQGGYADMPYQVPRWMQANGEIYGRGLGESVLADVKMLNRMDRTTIRAAEKLADPPLLAGDEGVVKAARTYSGGVTYGAIDSAGNALIKPLYTGANVSVAFEMMEARRNTIRDGFYFSLLQLVGSPNMTATEWLGRQEEKLRLMGPNLGRIQSEFLSPLIRRRFGILARANQLPPAPVQIRGCPLRVDYVSPLARAQAAGEAHAVVRLYESVIPLAGIDPSVMDNLNHDEAVQTLARGWSVPAKVLRDAAQVTAMRDERAAAATVETTIAAAKDGAEILQTLTDAAATEAASVEGEHA